jgi:ribosomal protein S18 acetylase RimI-like enzyme
MGDLRLVQSTASDVPELVSLCDAMMGRWYGRAGYLSAEHLATFHDTPGRDPGRDFPTVVLDGRIVVSTGVHATAPYTEVITSPLVDPGLDRSTLAAALDLVIASSREAALAHLHDAGADPSRSLLVVMALSENAPVREHLRARGFRVLREGHELVIELGGPSSEAPVPDGVRVVTLDPDDVPAAAPVLSSAFQDHHGDMAPSPEVIEHWMRGPSVRHDASFLAHDDDGIVGVLLAEDGTDGGYVAALGVERRGRGRGIGRALLGAAFGAFARSGAPRVVLDVDADNLTGATRLYESVGMRRRLTQELWAAPLLGG